MDLSRALRPTVLRDELRRVLEFRRAGLAAVAVVFNIAVLSSRAPDAFTNPQFWAEDGQVFFQDSHALGLESVLTPFAGYLHVVPRIVALICDVFSAVEAPTLYVLASVAVIAWTTATLALCADRSSPLYAVLVLSPPGCGELFATLTNVQWFMQVAALLVLVTPAPGRRILRANQILFVGAASVTGPFSIFLLPIAAVRIVRHGQDRHVARIACLVGLGASIQLYFVLSQSVDGGAGPFRPVHLIGIIASRWYYQLATDSLTYSLPGRVEAAVVFVGGLVVLGRREPKYMFMYLYCVVEMSATWFQHVHDSDYLSIPNIAERYFYAPRLIVIWCIADALCRFRRTSLLALAGAVIIASHYTHWRRVPLNDLPWRSVAWRIDRGEAVDIVINPSRPGDPTPYAVTLPARP